MIPVLILAGGSGTRLKSEVSDVPKPLASIAGIPFIHYLVDHLLKQGVQDVHFSLGYKGEAIEQSLKKTFTNRLFNYHYEPEPLGTGGALKFCWNTLKSENLMVLNGDSYAPFSIKEFSDYFKNKNLEAAILLRQIEDCSRFGSVEYDADNRIVKFKEKQSNTQSAWINAGVYILTKSDFFNRTQHLNSFSLEHSFFESHPHLYAFPTSGYFIDIGIPADFKRAQHELPLYKPSTI